MRILLFVPLLAVLATTVFAWEKEDHEIFDLVNDLETAEGKGTNFYSWLDVPSTATTGEIAKAYRKKSMQMHPDKNPNVPGVHERFSRLGVVANILRNSESRTRYDFFYKNGVPKWRGTGYYYSRYRPGLGAVFVFLTLLTSGLQYLVQRMNYSRDLSRIQNIMSAARSAAWGPKLAVSDGKKKVRVNIGGEDNARWLDMVVEGQSVSILEDGQLHPLDESAAIPPAITNTWFLGSLKSVVSRVIPSKNEAAATDSEMDDGDESESGSGTSTPRGQTTGLGAPASRAGGKRRKGVKKRT